MYVCVGSEVSMCGFCKVWLCVCVFCFCKVLVFVCVDFVNLCVCMWVLFFLKCSCVFWCEF